jgi:hypothetical protein
MSSADRMVRASSADKAAYALSFSSCRMLRLMEDSVFSPKKLAIH